MPWRNIQFGLSRLLKFHHDISPLVADGVVRWSISKEDKRRMEEMGLCTILDVGKVRFERWHPNTQFNDTKIECRNSWIGIEGLPINMWNVHGFKVIGQKCDELLDIARSTTKLTFLSHARVQRNGNKGGFIQEKMELFCWGK